MGTVWPSSALGEPLLRIRSTAGLATTDVACGGAGNRTLSITGSGSGSSLCADLAVPGRPMDSHA